MHFVVIGHFDSQEPIASVVEAESQSVAESALEAWARRETDDSSDFHIDTCESLVGMISDRIKMGGTLFLVAGHFEGEDIVSKVVEADSPDSLDVTIGLLEKYEQADDFDDREFYIDISVDLLGLIDDMIKAPT